jgi:hypothetical protein
MYDSSSYIVVKDKLGAVLGKLTHQHSDIDSVNVFLIAMKDNDNDEWDTEHKGHRYH